MTEEGVLEFSCMDNSFSTASCSASSPSTETCISPQQHRKRPQPPQLQVRMGGNPMIYANEHQRYTHGIEVGANETNRHSSLLLPTQTTPISIVASSSPLKQNQIAITVRLM